MDTLFKKYPAITIEYDSDIIEIPYITSVENLSKMFINRITVLYGPTNSRKTTSFKNLMYFLKNDFPRVVVYSPNNKSTGDYNKIVPAPLIHSLLNLNQLTTMYKNQEILTEKIQIHEKKLQLIFDKVKTTDDTNYIKTCYDKNAIKLHMINVVKKNKPYLGYVENLDTIIKNCSYNSKLLLILDDISSNINEMLKKKDEPVIKKLFYESRHVNISFVCILHNVTDLAPSFRQGVSVNIFCDKMTANSWFHSNMDPYTRKMATKAITEIFKGENHKMIYDKDTNKFYYMVPEKFDDFVMCSDKVRGAFCGISK